MKASGFDWDEKTTRAIEEMLDGLATNAIKIEFQGGEPTLRLDLVKRIIDRCDRFAERSFVICTNLSEVGPELLDLLERADVSVSTSLDGSSLVHSVQRTRSLCSNVASHTKRNVPSESWCM